MIITQTPTESMARDFLKSKGFSVQQLDWIGKDKDGNYTIFEIKERELFNPPPFLGTGLDKRQIYLRNMLLNDLKIRTCLMVYETGTNNMYYQFLDVLESGDFFDTKNDIRIYPIDNYKKTKGDRSEK